ncbi:MAG: flavin reductase family protein [Bacillota bacterium]|nr:flavin reductase family protein [Bacillota bacterium]
MKKIRLENRAVGPFPGMIVGAMVNGRPTYTTVGAGGCACLAPVLCVSLMDTHYITKGILESGYFSVNIPPSSLVKELDFCGIASGKNVDKSRLFTAFFDEAGQAPMIEECSLNFLCKVCGQKEIEGFTMFFGDIVAVFANEDCVVRGKVDPMQVDPIIMIAQSYCNLNSVIGLPFSEGNRLEKE